MYEAFSLKELGKLRMLVQIFQQIRDKKAKLSPEYIILVTDKHTRHLVSQFCSAYELIAYGSIYQIEKIEVTRKRYP